MIARTGHNFFKHILACGIAAASLSAGTIGFGQYRMDHIPDGPPMNVENPPIIDKLNVQVSLETDFTRSDGVGVKLADLFGDKKPVIVQMVYFSCPSLCNINQSALVDAVQGGPRGLALGTDYNIVIVSIDPDDTPELARQKRSTYLGRIGRGDSQPGFTYLTGSRENIDKLASELGFTYTKNPPGGMDKFAHRTVTYVLTPGGRLSSTIKNADYTPDELHKALSDAADGKIGTTSDRIALSCGAMRFNAQLGKYEANPWFWAGTAGGLASMAFMAIFLGLLWRGEFKKKKLESPGFPPATP